MKKDSRLSNVLHVLLHMAQKPEVPLRSEDMAKAMNTNPVVARRVMAGLRRKGYVQSEKGHGGGWLLTCDLSTTTLKDVYEALGPPSLLAIGPRSEHPECIVEASVNSALEVTYRQAQEILIAGLDAITLASLTHDVIERIEKRKIQAQKNTKADNNE
ncbi:Rrf2 family transcriptional regulator [Methylophilus sp. 3sh_L]|uniref:Rrf2 family transcriptional regulator n=1 Tax=Methylophilus sp. 3sh_L TaxID=3377114 RepID=UPI00398EA66C